MLNLHSLREKLDAMLIREGRMELAKACFDFLPTRARLDLAGWEEAFQRFEQRDGVKLLLAPG